MSPKQVAHEMAAHPKKTEEDKFYREHIFFMSDWLTFVVDRLRGRIETEEGRRYILERLDRAATNERNRDLWLTPDKIEAFGSGLVSLAQMWRDTDWQKTRRENHK